MIVYIMYIKAQRYVPRLLSINMRVYYPILTRTDIIIHIYINVYMEVKNCFVLDTDIDIITSDQY